MNNAAEVEIMKLRDNSYVVKAYHDKLSEVVGRQYAMVRKSKGLTQQEVAKMSGIKRPNIARLESGRHSPSLDILAKVADSMGMRLEIRLTEK